MISLNCRLARMDPVVLPGWISEGAQVLAERFRSFSRGDIELSVDISRLAHPRKATLRAVQAYDLHEATADVAGNVKGKPVRNIALLLASRYDYANSDNIFGIMFDRGFGTGDDPSGSKEYREIPREGCAVFLDAIRSKRAGKDDFEAESRYTCIHELGHVFNLLHLSKPPNFMVSSNAAKVYGDDYQLFTEDQCDKLARCSTSADVRPGGSRFADSGPSGNLNELPTRAPKSAFGLELRIELATREFWPFEPVELDITLRVMPGIDRTFKVPDQIDPGYDSFAIWIEEPDGERRRYRSPRRYCAAEAWRTIAPAAPFQRDVSLFGESGRFCFEKSGIHRVWTEFAPSRQHKLVSNTLELVIKAPAKGNLYEDARAVLANDARARLLYHRVVRSGSRNLRSLLDFCAAYERWPGIAGVQYGVGRALWRKASKHPLTSRSAQLAGEATELLARAADKPTLGETQRRHAQRLLAKVAE